MLFFQKLGELVATGIAILAGVKAGIVAGAILAYHTRLGELAIYGLAISVTLIVFAGVLYLAGKLAEWATGYAYGNRRVH